MSVIPIELEIVELIWKDKHNNEYIEGESYIKGQHGQHYKLERIEGELNLDTLREWLKQGYQSLPNEALIDRLEDISVADNEPWEHVIALIHLANDGHDYRREKEVE